MILASKKAKLKWQCRRGMLELDLLLKSFIEGELDNLTEIELDTLDSLLSQPDPVLYDWLMGSSSPEDKELSSLVEFIRQKYSTH